MSPQNITATRSGGQSVPKARGIDGRLALIGEEPLIEADPGAPVTLKLFGIPGHTYTLEVTVRGPTIQVVLNGTKIIDGDVSKVTEFMGNKKHPGKDLTEGHFGFCGHSDPVAFRNIQIKRLDAPKK